MKLLSAVIVFLIAASSLALPFGYEFRTDRLFLHTRDAMGNDVHSFDARSGKDDFYLLSRDLLELEGVLSARKLAEMQILEARKSIFTKIKDGVKKAGKDVKKDAKKVEKGAKKALPVVEKVSSVAGMVVPEANIVGAGAAVADAAVKHK